MKYTLPSNDPLMVKQAMDNGNLVFLRRDDIDYRIASIMFTQYSDMLLSPIIASVRKVDDLKAKRNMLYKFVVKDTDIITTDDDKQAFVQLILSGAQ